MLVSSISILSCGAPFAIEFCTISKEIIVHFLGGVLWGDF